MLLALTCLLLGVSATQALAVKRAFTCGSNDYLIQNNGIVVSHGGLEANHNYGKNMDCIWRIEAPVGQYVELTKQSFNVEDDPACSYDYLQLFDGNSTNSPSLGKFCGNTFQQISSTGRFLTLTFITDDDTQLSGFSLFYNFTNTIIRASCQNSEFQCLNGKCLDPSYRCDNDDDCGDDSDEQNCHGVSPGVSPGVGLGSCTVGDFTCDNGVCVPRAWLCDGDNDCSDNSDERPSSCNAPSSALCGGTNFTGDAGTISSPNNPGLYPNDANCLYYVQGPAGTKTIAFKFDDIFDIEADSACSYDFVTIYADGHSFNHGPFCGNISPGQMTIPGNHAYVQFVSDDDTNGSGFRLDWKALQ